MAYMNTYQAHPYLLEDGEWVKDKTRTSKTNYSISWSNGTPWLEAVIYLSNRNTKSETIRCNAYDLLAYADWLEANNLDWLHFPIRESDRCLHRFRGFLVDSGVRTSGVPSRRMNTVINFYRWAKNKNLIDKNLKTWEELRVKRMFFDAIGFSRSIDVCSTDLRISNRRANITKLEDGLTPISAQDRDVLLGFLKNKSSEQSTILHAMLVLGFFTGARLGSIRTLRVEHLKNATPDKEDPRIFLVAAGPSTGINTKHDVRGYLRFLKPVHDFILAYAETNISRLERQFKAAPENKSLIFLTKDGKPYSQGSINTAMSDLRKELVAAGLTQFHDFKFHQSRATCGTELARLFMQQSDAEAIEMVRDWLMHKEVSTTWSYVKFIEKSKVSAQANSEFIQYFLGPKFLEVVNEQS